jgi:hypothetical protein
VGPTAGLDAVVKRKIPSPLEPPIIQLLAQRSTTELSRLPGVCEMHIKFWFGNYKEEAMWET